jgi:hypothetical protein
VSLAPSDRGFVIRYLLGQLNDEESTQVEIRYFKSSEFLEEIEVAELELIEQYLDCTLSDEDRKSFEKKYLTSPTLREKVVIAEALRLRRPRGEVVWIYALVAATTLMAILAAWSLNRNSRLNETTRAVERELERERKKSPLRPVVVAAFSLTPGSTRELASRQRITIPADASVLRLHLALEANSKASAYRAALRTIDQRPVRDWGNVPVRSGRSIELGLPATDLEPDDYILSLEPAFSGSSSHPSFVFHLSRQK